MTINLSSKKSSTIIIKTKFLDSDKYKPVTIRLPSPDKALDYKSIKRQLGANFIHSLDASNIHLLIKNIMDQNLYLRLYTIHDCFASN